MDTVYPEPTSLLYRRPVRKKPRGGAARHRTQPVTFAEIQEVDEENLEDIPEGKSTSKKNWSDVDLNRKFDEFRKLRDKRYSKSETDSPGSSPIGGASPEVGPTEPPSLTEGEGAPAPATGYGLGKGVQRPSI